LGQDRQEMRLIVHRYPFAAEKNVRRIECLANFKTEFSVMELIIQTNRYDIDVAAFAVELAKKASKTITSALNVLRRRK
jgi:hypothetical protein